MSSAATGKSIGMTDSDFCFRLAGIALVMSASEGYAYITKRVDRNIEGDDVQLFAIEDFCQLSNRLTQEKYKGSYEVCGRIIRKYSDRPGLDLSELFLRVDFSFIIGNLAATVDTGLSPNVGSSCHAVYSQDNPITILETDISVTGESSRGTRSGALPLTLAKLVFFTGFIQVPCETDVSQRA